MGLRFVGWFGVFRDAPFGDRERSLLAVLVNPLRERARLERLLDPSRGLGVIDAALDAIGAAAFLVVASGAVVFANAAGRALLARDAAATREALRDAARGSTARFRTVRIAARAMADHRLVVEQPLAATVAARLPRVAALWSLTTRQTDVLALLARGQPNKTIASSLTCSVRTVELHVTALLDKADVESRAELVARFWTG